MAKANILARNTSVNAEVRNTHTHTHTHNHTVSHTWTNRGMFCMLAISPLLMGSLARMCRAPVQPSTISSIRTPSCPNTHVSAHDLPTRLLLFHYGSCSDSLRCLRRFLTD